MTPHLTITLVAFSHEIPKCKANPNVCGSDAECYCEFCSANMFRKPYKKLVENKELG